MSECIAVAGLGLIGGSLAKALKLKAGVRRIIGIDTDQTQLDAALEAGVISEGYSEPGEYIKSCDMVYLCVPVPVCADLALKIHSFADSACIITDAASTKADIINKIKNNSSDMRFVGGHPMAGSERSGFAYSREDMFENAYYIILNDGNDMQAVEKVKEMALAIGAIPILTDSLSHDRAVAIVSHVPHVTAAALVNLLDSDKNGELGKKIAAGGFRDITRIASSQPALWRDITLSNRDAVTEGIDRLISILESARDSINSQKRSEIEDYFDSAKNARDILSGEREGLLPRKYQIVIQVSDKPGVIAHIANILGENGINIRNINVTHSREDVGGVLVVELYTLENRINALDILSGNGYWAEAID